MTISVELKITGREPYKHRYEDVVKFSVFSKEEIAQEIDSTTYEEFPDNVFRMYFKNGETATFGYDLNFKFKVLNQFNS